MGDLELLESMPAWKIFVLKLYDQYGNFVKEFYLNTDNLKLAYQRAFDLIRDKTNEYEDFILYELNSMMLEGGGKWAAASNDLTADSHKED